MIAATVWMLGTIVVTAAATKDADDVASWGVAIVAALCWPIAIPVILGFYIGHAMRGKR